MLAKILIISLLWMSAIFPSHASSLLPLSLDEIVQGAKLGFQGICTANRSERDSKTGLIVTYTSFSVTDVLMGNAASTHTIKQVGGQAGNDTFEVHGVPSFAVGQEYVVFLYGVSSAGFSSPVGLSQGQFVVRRGPNGPEISNGRDFKELMKDQAGSAMPQAVADKLQNTLGAIKSLDLDEFKQLVRQRSGGAK